MGASPTVDEPQIPLLEVSGDRALALGPALQYFVDSHGDHELDSVQALPAEAWTRSTVERLSLGIGKDVIWLRTRLRLPAGVQTLRIFCEQRLEKITLYWQDSPGGDRKFVSIDGGIAAPRNQHRLPYFDLPVTAGETELLVYLRIQSRISLRMPFYAGTIENFYERDGWLTLMNGIFFAFIGVIILFNFGTAWRIRSTLPLIYSVWLFCIALFQFVIAGYFFRGVSASLFWNERLGLIISCLNSIPFVIFYDRLLLLKIHAPYLRALLYACLPFALGLSIAAAVPALEREFLNRLVHLMLLIFLSGLIAGGLRAVWFGFRPALYSIAGSGIFTVSLAFYLLGGLGIAPSNHFTDNGMLFGFLGEFLFFILSISARANLLESAVGSRSEASAISAYASDLRQERSGGKSTLVNVDLQALDRELDRLMLEERVYCDEDLSLQRLAALLDISAHQLSEFLNKNRKKRFNHFLNEYRIAEARRILRADNDRTVLDVALAVGFNSRSSFNAEFKRTVGATPSEYRSQNQP